MYLIDTTSLSPVGSGKTALMLKLCLALREKYSIAAVTNDIFTREDCEFLTRHKALPAERREHFLIQVFWNAHDIITVNTKVRARLFF